MGGRIDGKKKKKSVKANVTSKFGSKRKLSRMGKEVKKGQMGANTEFITRSSALKRLQITLKDFRRLCILKGVYPRVPPKGPKGNDKVYYDIKDISYVMHEPLLNKFREFKSFMKKIRKSSGRNQYDEARRKNELKPKFTLDHLVKERYPRFIDALRDLDDALCMIHLFASLPSQGRIIAERTQTCQQLASHWQYYVSKSRSLHKVFISVKGVYFQAEVMGEPINWLAPHKFTQALPREVDIRVMLTFLEFYEVFVKFTLYKLYHMQGMQYPPKIDKQMNDAGCFLLSVKSAGLDVDEDVEKDVAPAATKASTSTDKKDKTKKAAVDPATAKRLASLPKLLESIANDKEEEDEDEEELGLLSAPLTDAFSSLQDDANNVLDKLIPSSKEEEEERKQTFVLSEDEAGGRGLFAGLVFFINREVPLEWLQLSVTAFDGKVGWDGEGSMFKVDDPRITHQVVDRPVQGLQLSKSREYVQPQWVFDSINCKLQLPVLNYSPGSKLPPHLSPFVDDDKEGYLPKYREELRKLKGQTVGGKGNAASTKETVPENDDEEENYGKDVQSERRGEKRRKDKGRSDDEDEEEDEDGGSENESEEEEEGSDAEAEAEAEPVALNKGVKGVVHQPKQAKLTEEEEAKELSKIMMSKKTKRLYGRMQHGIEKKQQAVAQLEMKRQQEVRKAKKTKTTSR